MIEKVLLTIDSGGSKTCLALYADGEKLIQTGQTKGYGRAVAETTDLPDFSAFLQDFCKGYEVKRVVCNLGGKNDEQIKSVIQTAFPTAPIRIFRESQGVIGETLCEKYGAQVTLMAGTGSIAVAKSGEKTVISGGWGANVSDEGSGYALGLEAVRLALREIDGVQPLSLVAKRLTGLESPPDFKTAEEYCALRDSVRARLAPFDRAHIAAFEKTLNENVALEKAYYLPDGIGEAMLDIAKKEK